eukprot:2015807-Pyramimonas_sp.AAC.1
MLSPGCATSLLLARMSRRRPKSSHACSVCCADILVFSAIKGSRRFRSLAGRCPRMPRRSQG